MAHSTITNWHVVISGFLQEKGAPNGMYKLWRTLHEQFADSETHVDLSTWNDNHSALAEMIWRSGNGQHPVVKVYGLLVGRWLRCDDACARTSEARHRRQGNGALRSGLPLAVVAISLAGIRALAKDQSA